MPDEIAPAPAGRMPALAVVCVLAAVSVVVAFLGATPTRVSAGELLGEPRSPGERAFVAAHRGGASEGPENTLPAVSAALANAYDYVEVDVALTRDGIPVLMHDATVDRTTDGTGAVADLTLAEVRTLDAGSWFDARYAGTPVPTLTEFLEVLGASGKKALVELKGAWPEASVQGFVQTVEEHGLDDKVAVASFDARILADVAAASTVLQRLAIFRTLPADVAGAASDLDVGGVVVHRAEVLARPAVVETLRAAGLRIVLYTLNDDVEWASATELGVDGIITDAPRSLTAWQASTTGPPR